eukprot:scaffold35930_cov55-Attheya_sp.AAC.4
MEAEANELMDRALRSLGGNFHRDYAASFIENELTIEMLAEMGLSDWKEIRVSIVGHRIKIKRACMSLLPSTERDDKRPTAVEPQPLSTRIVSPDNMNAIALSSPKDMLPHGEVSYVTPVAIRLASTVMEDPLDSIKILSDKMDTLLAKHMQEIPLKEYDIASSTKRLQTIINQTGTMINTTTQFHALQKFFKNKFGCEMKSLDPVDTFKKIVDATMDDIPSDSSTVMARTHFTRAIYFYSMILRIHEGQLSPIQELSLKKM